jgi:hypothetical protein
MAKKSKGRRKGSSYVDRLAGRLGVEGLAARIGVTESTVRRWRAEGPPESRRQEVRGAWERSERASYAASVQAERQRERRAIVEEEETGPKGWRELAEPGIAERASKYPRVANRFRRTSLLRQRESVDRELESLGAEEPLQWSEQDLVLDRLSRASDTAQSFDAAVRIIEAEGEYSAHELYTLFLSPEAA